MPPGFVFLFIFLEGKFSIKERTVGSPAEGHLALGIGMKLLKIYSARRLEQIPALVLVEITSAKSKIKIWFLSS